MSELLAKTLRSSTFRQALAAILIFGAVVVGLFAYVFWATTNYVLDHSTRATETEMGELRDVFVTKGRDALIAALSQKASVPASKSNVYLLADPSFAPVAGNLAGWPPSAKTSVGWVEFRMRNGAPLLGAVAATLPDGSHLLVGRDIAELDRFTEKIKAAFVFSLAFIFALAVFASVAVTRRTVGRIEAVNATSRAIMQCGLGQRIPLRGTHDEWDELAANLNRSLDRIEELMEQVKQVSDNVAHDLRTPLARMRGRLEKAYHGEREAARDQSVIGEAIIELDGVLRMFASLTRISQIEANEGSTPLRPVNLFAIANEVVELFDAAAEESGVHLKVIGDPDVVAMGDRDLLFDAVANLVDNAVKHGRPKGQVSVEVKKSDGDSVVSVADDGPGIPLSEHQHVFERFYRLERSRQSPGNGLGLSLVAAVARLHGARVELIDKAPGLVVRLKLQQSGELRPFSSEGAG
ncbi:HAMP domain-containing sensor histidine kinase [Rhodoblastus sp. 17X3]|uniref:sensor histidine kinase n=1 Tax=Rhodoblastus sp. 17X3 TaxID=3047026 RepID=UPI0024B79145|nr:HAMP domain-containing sensor histidine kinase [Rhodoblastus sp. 17X3]MDI9846449.1 HAMP domain-containing sensor histidine kinase [Rhodoblastus sp. 17X3]